MEIWKTHKVYNSIQVSNLGNVRNALTFEIKKQHISDTGYYKCNAKGSNGWKTLRVNRLIADMFCENPNNLPFVDHINAIKTDNRAENLRYITQSDNLKAYKNVELINSAIGKEYGFVRTVDVLGNIGMNFLIPDNLGGIVIYSLNQMEIDRIDFIKIDVEGYELDVLIGGKETINKFKPTMLIEINDATLSRQGISRNDIFAWLTENNYIYRNIYKEQGLNDSQLDIICTPNDIRNT